ncbi:sugar phosphate isomerase/epimerase family protein [Paenibacillus tarimensis]
MNIGISRPSWEERDSEQIFRLAHEYKFDGVQIKPQQYEPLGLDAERFKEQYGDLAYLARGGIIVYPGSSYRTWAERFSSFLSFAKGVGGKQICICAGVRERDLDSDGLKGFSGVLNELGRQANGAGAVISLHNHADTILESIDDIKRIFEHIDPACCGLTFDTAHAAKGGIEDLAGALEQFKPFVNNIHLKDLSGDGKFCLLGRGTLDLKSVLHKLSEWDYREWLIVDEETAGVSVREAFAGSAAFLREGGLLGS